MTAKTLQRFSMDTMHWRSIKWM